MKTILVTLTQPFIRHPAGQVFELREATGISGWDDDERVRDRQHFTGKQIYYLPDGGNGLACALPVSMTALCPPEVFEAEDLHSGPCRITGANRIDAQTVTPDSNLKYGIALSEINEHNAQGLQLPADQWATAPKLVRLRDRLRAAQVRVWEWEAVAHGLIDCSGLAPGFFQLEIEISSVLLYQVLFIKSFPLVVQFAPNGRYTTQKTIY